MRRWWIAIRNGILLPLLILCGMVGIVTAISLIPAVNERVLAFQAEWVAIATDSVDGVFDAPLLMMATRLDRPLFRFALLLLVCFPILYPLAARVREALPEAEDDTKRKPLSIHADLLRARRTDYLLAARTRWLERLRNSLEEQIRLELAFESMPEMAVGYDPRFDHRVGRKKIVVDASTSLADLFAAHGRAMLILGSPGSGKTTTLLHLAEQLFEQAIQNESNAIPIVLNLSSWAWKQEPMEEWIATQLQRSGLMPDQAITASWLEGGNVVIMLDALDEVARSERNKCIKQINRLRKKYALVVTCREKQYRALKRLDISYVMRIQPFSQDTIVAHLGRYNRDLSGLIQVVQEGNGLWERLLSVPLMLTLAAVTLEGVSVETLRESDNLDAARRNLFRRFVVHMLKHRPLTATGYTVEKVVGSLRAIAKQMSVHEQTQFIVEEVQPSWLPKDHLHVRWRLRTRSGIGAIFAIVGAAAFYASTFLIENLQPGARGWIAIGAFFGFGLGISDLSGKWISDEIVLPERVSFRRPSLREVRRYLSWDSPGYGLGDLFLATRQFSNLPISPDQQPFERLRRSRRLMLRLAMRAGGWFLLYGVFVLILTLDPVRLGEGAVVDLTFAGRWLAISMIFSLIVARNYGGAEAIYGHYVLRMLLYRHGILPHSVSNRKLVNFFDVTVERALMRRVGGGWEFVHLYVRDYFAGLSDDEVDAIAEQVREQSGEMVSAEAGGEE